MVFRSSIFFLVSLGVLVALQTLLPKASAKTPDYDYVAGLDYPLDFGAERPAKLPEFIVDYANMIRNDIILLDNSVETRTRKRGNIKVKKHSNQAMSHVPCNCVRDSEADDDGYVNLTDALGMAQWYPVKVKNLTCDDSKCTRPYRCQKIIYNQTVLKRSDSKEERDTAGDLYKYMHNELKHKWTPRVLPLVAGCVCSSSYLDN